MRHGALETVLGIEIRAGLHTGEVGVRDDDISGLTVNIAARVLGLARAGEVLVSRTVADLVAGAGFRFEDRGEHELRGVPGSSRVHAVSGWYVGRDEPPPPTDVRRADGRSARGGRRRISRQPDWSG